MDFFKEQDNHKQADRQTRWGLPVCLGPRGGLALPSTYWTCPNGKNDSYAKSLPLGIPTTGSYNIYGIKYSFPAVFLNSSGTSPISHPVAVLSI